MWRKDLDGNKSGSCCTKRQEEKVVVRPRDSGEDRTGRVWRHLQVELTGLGD